MNHLKRRIPPFLTSSHCCLRRYSSSTSISTGGAAELAPPHSKSKNVMGVFYDLDNCNPSILSRQYIREWIHVPLSRVQQEFEIDECKKVAVGNTSTMMYISKDERQRLQQLKRDIKVWDVYTPETYTTGYDTKTKDLRCGVCGSKHATVEKLIRHFKIHVQEQRKLKNKPKHKKLKSVDRKRLYKYSRAEIGISPPHHTKPTPLRRLLKDIAGFSCYEVGVGKNKADQKLIQLIHQWIGQLSENDKTSARVRRYLLLISNDGDYKSVLQHAQSKGIITIGAHHKPENVSHTLLPWIDHQVDLGRIMGG